MCAEVKMLRYRDPRNLPRLARRSWCTPRNVRLKLEQHREMAAERILHLTLHREFFQRIAEGTKREEYRDRTNYWKTRLEGRDYDIIRFRNGYAAKAPEMDVEWKGLNPRRKDCYAIRLGKILNLKHWRAGAKARGCTKYAGR